MPISWIDTHCHLDAPEFAADRLAVRAAARAAGVAHCVLVAVERSNWQAVRDLAARGLGTLKPLEVPAIKGG